MKGDITMSNKELLRIETISKAANKLITQKQAAQLLGLSKRQIIRLVIRFREYGAKGLVHALRGRKSNNKIDKKVLDEAIAIIKRKYHDFGPTLANEKLTGTHNFCLSTETLRKEMIKQGLWKGKKRRKARAHQLRRRRACFGELAQLDGSPHAWFEDRGPPCNLNIDIDDATGKIVLLFSKSETTQSYFQLLEKRIKMFGIPVTFYTDKHSVFVSSKSTNPDYTKPDKARDRNRGQTQFARALKELGIKLILASGPQAKGRVERMAETLQDRLVKEMRLNNICTIVQANEFLKEYVVEFNERFNYTPSSPINMHRQVPKNLDLSKIICVKEYRRLSKNLNFQYNKNIYQIKTDRSAYGLRGMIVTIRIRYNGSITVSDNKDELLNYELFRRVNRVKTANSKQVNAVVDDILVKSRKKKNPWETSFDQVGEVGFYKPAGAV